MRREPTPRRGRRGQARRGRRRSRDRRPAPRPSTGPRPPGAPRRHGRRQGARQVRALRPAQGAPRDGPHPRQVDRARRVPSFATRRARRPGRPRSCSSRPWPTRRTTTSSAPDDLVVRKAYVDEGPTLKRYRPRALGRATRIRKRTSHMTIELITEGVGRTHGSESPSGGPAGRLHPRLEVDQWFNEREFSDYLLEDIHIRDHIENKLAHAGLSDITIRKNKNEVEVNIHTARPGHRDRQVRAPRWTRCGASSTR